MWKKIVVMGIALIGTFSVVYAMNHDMFANVSSSTYNAGGEVTGRINQAPAGITGSNIGMQKGDKVYIGVTNPLDSKPLGFQLLYDAKNYNTYDVTITGTKDLPNFTATKNGTESAWFSMSTKGITSPMAMYSVKPEVIPIPGVPDYSAIINISLTHNGYNTVNSFNITATNELRGLNDITTNGYLDALVESKNAVCTGSCNLYQNMFSNSVKLSYTNKFYLPDATTLYSKSGSSNVPNPSSGFHMQDADASWNQTYFVSGFNALYLMKTHLHEVITADGARKSDKVYVNYDEIASTRVATMLKMDNVVFALQQGTSPGIAKTTEKILSSSYSNIYTETLDYGEMKLRIENSALTNSTTLSKLVRHDDVELNKISKNSIIYLDASAQAGSNADGVNTVSAIIFDKDGAFKYYKPLESAKGAGKYALDLTDIPIGTYKIGIVNEVYNESSIVPADCSKITDVKSLEIVEPLSELTHTPSHTSTGTDYYFSSNKGNVLSSNKVASLSTKNGAGSANGENGIVYKLQPSSIVANVDDYKSFTIPTESGSEKPVLDTGKPYIIAKPSSGDYLLPGVYKYRVQAYDANGDPVAYEASDTTKANPYAQLNDGTIVKGITPSQGLITEDITTVVYPHESQISYAQSKDSDGQYYKKGDINASDFTGHLGALTFATEANMQKLFDAGYTINTTSSKLMKKGSTTDQISALKISADTTNKSKYYIDKNSNVESGTYEFDAWLYFKNSSGDTALLKVTDQSMFIAPSITYVNPDKITEALGKDTYERKYDAYASSDNKENIFTLVATDKTDYTSNSNVLYCIYDETLKTCASSNDNDVVTLVDNLNGTATLTAKTYHKDDPDIIIRAYMEDSKGTILTYQNLTIKINRSERKLKWEGKGVSSLSSTVTLKDDGNYELILPYDSASTEEYSFSKILKDAVEPANGILALRHDEGTGTISTTMSGNLASGIATDSFKLTNKCTGTTCYIEVSKTQDDIYEAQTLKLYIVSEDMAAIEDSKISWKYNENNTWKVVSSPLSIRYKKDGVVPVMIDSSKLPTDIKNVKVKYTLDDAKKVDTITVANKTNSDTEAEVSILQANQGSDNASIKAVITSDNYAKKTVTLPVKVNKLAQTINFNTAFKDLATSIKINPSTNYNYEAELQVDSSTAGAGTINYTVAGNPVNMLTNNSENKTFNVTKAGSVTITATLTDDKNYTSTTKTVTKTITYFADAGLTWAQDSTKPEAVNTINGGTTGNADVNKEIGNIGIDGGKSSAYNFTIDNTKHSDDSTYFTVVLNSDKKTGRIKIIKKIDAATLQTHATQVGVGDTYEWSIHVKAVGTTDSTDKAESDIVITFTGAQPDITFTSATNKKITDTYDPTKDIDLNVKRGGTAVSTPTISFVGYTSALSLKPDGVNATIKAANTDNSDAVRSGRKIEVKAEVTASSGYKTGTSDLNEIVIKKAIHPTIDFVGKTLSSSNNVDVLIEGILNGNDKFNEDVTITPIKVDAFDAWVIESYTVSKGEAYEQPKMEISPKGYLGTIDFAITASGDDNYKPLPDNTKTTLEFTENGGISYKPINVNYGDKTKNVLDFIVSPNPKDDPDTVTYAYSGYDDTLITVDSDGKITPLKVGTTTLTFKRMDSADNSEMEQNIKVTVKPKDITIYVNDLHMKVGEVISVDDYSIDTTKSTAFESGDDVGALTYSCQDNNVEVTSLANGLQGPAPKVLSINVTHVGGDASKKANYAITYMPGNLNITQDEAQESWISVLPKGTTTLQNNWYNGDVEIKLNAISGSYTEISPDGNAPWGNSFTISEEGKITQNISFRDPTSLARATSISKELLIDRNAPRVESIKAKSSNNKLEDIMNNMTFGLFFKPGTEFTITTTDKQTGRSVNQVSGTNSLTYSIYKVEKDNSETVLEKDKTITIKNEAVKIKISDHSGTYKVCTIATDLAGNKGTTQNCASVKIGYENTNIPTGDNDCPDINLDFNDDGVIDLNEDVNGDKIPDLNIDSDFDGEADINVDSDGDQKPDLNLVILSKWNPGMCSIVEGKTYATMEDIKPEINIVIDNGIDEIKKQAPAINIDNKGDFKPHLNLSKDGVTPYLNITTIHEWKPIHDYSANNFAYDSIGKDKGEPFAEYNYDSDDDGKADINVDLNNDKTPDINLDKDYDGIPDLNIDGNGDGEPDYNLDAGDDGIPTKNVVQITEWKPDLDGNKDGNEFDTMKIELKNELEDNGVAVEKPSGGFLPNYSIKVKDVSDSVEDKVKEDIGKLIKDQEIKTIYDVNLWKDDVLIQPDGSIRVKIPYDETIKNPKVIIELANGSFKEVDAVLENGYLVYDTDFLGKVSVIGDKETSNVPDEEDPDVPIPDFKPNGNGGSTPNTSVKGDYTSGIGGAGTGDTVMLLPYGISMSIAIGILFLICFVRKKHHDI